MHDYPQFSFWISITLVKMCFSRIFSKLRKNTFELVGTVLKVFDSFSVFIEPISYQRIFHLVSVLYITPHLVNIRNTRKDYFFANVGRVAHIFEKT